MSLCFVRFSPGFYGFFIGLRIGFFKFYFFLKNIYFKLWPCITTPFGSIKSAISFGSKVLHGFLIQSWYCDWVNRYEVKYVLVHVCILEIYSVFLIVDPEATPSRGRGRSRTGKKEFEVGGAQKKIQAMREKRRQVITQPTTFYAAIATKS